MPRPATEPQHSTYLHPQGCARRGAMSSYAGMKATPITIPIPAEMAEIAGMLETPENLLRLLEAHAGTRVFIPKTATASTRLAQSIGIEGAARLAAMYGGDYLQVPIARAWRVKVYREQRWPQTRIATKLGITESQVWRLLRDAGLTAPQRRNTPARSVARTAPTQPGT
ncbi:MAG: hypothetical protein K2X46_04980 [Roseomonas sp.]|nr:hypothetical protein [Roseomonas sp.]